MVTPFGVGRGLYKDLSVPMTHLIKKSISIAGHRTSIALESAFWDVLDERATAEGRSLISLIAAIDHDRQGPLTSALRVCALNWLRQTSGSLSELR